jgi:hypothetical protein
MVASIQVKKYSSQRKKVIFMVPVPVPNKTVCVKKMKFTGRKNIHVGAGDVIRNYRAEVERNIYGSGTLPS